MRSSLPITPLKPVTIGARTLWPPLDWREIWQGRGVLLALVIRDMKVRYRHTLLGGLWLLLQPMLTAAIFSLLLGSYLNAPSEGVPYWLFVYVGILPWTLLHTSLLRASSSLIDAETMVTTLYFPRIFLPLAAMGSALIDFTVSLILAIGVIVYLDPSRALDPSGALNLSSVLFIPFYCHFFASLLYAMLLLLLLCVLLLPIAIALSAALVLLRDLQHLLPVLLQLLLYATPILYSAKIVPTEWQWLLSYNPLIPLLCGFRDTLLAIKTVDFPSLPLHYIMLTAAILTVPAWVLFRYTEQRLAERL